MKDHDDNVTFIDDMKTTTTCKCQSNNTRTERNNSREDNRIIYNKTNFRIYSHLSSSTSHCRLWGTIFAFSLLLVSMATAVRDVEYGKQLKMSCFPKGKEKTTNRKFEWLKDGKAVEYNNRIIQKKNYSVLKIRNAMPEDTGIYACVEVTSGSPNKELAAYNVSLIPGKFLVTLFVCVSHVFVLCERIFFLLQEFNFILKKK